MSPRPGIHASPRLALAFLAAAAPGALAGGAAWGVSGALDALVLAAFALDLLRAPPPARLRIDREVPAVARIDEERAVAVRVSNPLHRPLDLVIRDHSHPSLRRTPDRHHVRLPPSGRGEVRAAILPSRRGRLALGPITVRTFGPLGLGGRQASLPVAAIVKVFPLLPGRAEVDLRLERARLLQSGERSALVRGGGSDFDSLREYHPDDEFRRINWRATARSARAVSNVYREERNQQVLLLFDASRMTVGSVAGVPRFEHLLDAGFAVAELATRVGDRVGTVAFGRDVVAMVPPRGGRSQSRRVLESLFDVEPTVEGADYVRAFALSLGLWRRRSLLVVLSELADPATIEPLFRALPVLLARHLVVLGAVSDPFVEGLARAVPESSEAAYAKAAAAGALAVRASATARLRGMGVRVVDRPPGKLAGALADQYLRIKAYGRL